MGIKYAGAYGIVLANSIVHYQSIMNYLNFWSNISVEKPVNTVSVSPAKLIEAEWFTVNAGVQTRDNYWRCSAVIAARVGIIIISIMLEKAKHLTIYCKTESRLASVEQKAYDIIYQ